MDDYLSKPIDVTLLIATVEGMDDPNRAAAAAAQPAQAPQAHHGSHVVFEEAAALRRTGGDRKLLKQVIALYRADAPVSVRKMARAVSGRDAEALRIAAHTLKGSVATVGGVASRYAAATLEDLGRAGKTEGADAALTVLRGELARLETAFVAARLASASARTKAKKRRTTKRRVTKQQATKRRSRRS
jgi:HPt (histidine-containing phosphotransfer) domain-containing protein